MSLTKDDLYEIKKLLDIQTKIIRGEFADFISDHVLPQIDKLNNRANRIEGELKGVKDTVDRVDRRFERVEDRSYSHDVSLKKLEKIHPEGQHSSV